MSGKEALPDHGYDSIVFFFQIIGTNVICPVLTSPFFILN